jgi:hypothetical protein
MISPASGTAAARREQHSSAEILATIAGSMEPSTATTLALARCVFFAALISGQGLVSFAFLFLRGDRAADLQEVGQEPGEHRRVARRQPEPDRAGSAL